MVISRYILANYERCIYVFGSCMIFVVCNDFNVSPFGQFYQKQLSIMLGLLIMHILHSSSCSFACCFSSMTVLTCLSFENLAISNQRTLTELKFLTTIYTFDSRSTRITSNFLTSAFRQVNHCTYLTLLSEGSCSPQQAEGSSRQ